MVEWWVWWIFESERFLLLFVLAPDPAFRSLGGNFKSSHVSSSNFKFYPLKERGESSKFQKPLGFANAQNSSRLFKIFQGLHNQLPYIQLQQSDETWVKPDKKMGFSVASLQRQKGEVDLRW
jgi:hypothetical protein